MHIFVKWFSNSPSLHFAWDRRGRSCSEHYDKQLHYIPQRLSARAGDGPRALASGLCRRRAGGALADAPHFRIHRLYARLARGVAALFAGRIPRRGHPQDGHPLLVLPLDFAAGHGRRHQGGHIRRLPLAADFPLRRPAHRDNGAHRRLADDAGRADSRPRVRDRADRPPGRRHGGRGAPHARARVRHLSQVRRPRRAPFEQSPLQGRGLPHPREVPRRAGDFGPQGLERHLRRRTRPAQGLARHPGGDVRPRGGRRGRAGRNGGCVCAAACIC